MFGLGPIMVANEPDAQDRLQTRSSRASSGIQVNANANGINNDDSLESNVSSRTGSSVETATTKKKFSSRWRFFSRQSNQSVLVAQDPRKIPSEIGYGGATIIPCPFIHINPNNKLEPRIEQHPMSRNSDFHDDGSSIIAVARKKGEAREALNLGAHSLGSSYSAIDDEATPAEVPSPNTVQESDSRVIESGSIYSEPSTAARRQENLISELEQQKEQVAITSAKDLYRVTDWRVYIDCYAKGQYNLSCPPPPPARSSTFEYLPAIFPSDEAKRMSVCATFDIVWPLWARERAGALILAAMKKFDTRNASLSFFDGNLESFKAENGYHRPHVARKISIAAHALLSQDVFVILDTHEDWRFKGNPLVIGKPNIRFFAGAPMLAPGGHAVGVFAVFGGEPRSEFNASQRRELAEFAALSLTDLNLQADWLSDPELRSTPILERKSLINGLYRPNSFDASSRSADAYSTDQEMSLQLLRYHEQSPPSPTRKSRVIINRQSSDRFSRSSFVETIVSTPPSSDNSDDGLCVAPTRGFGKNYNNLLVDSRMQHRAIPQDFHQMMTPDSRGFSFDSPSPRPFSASDLTSLDLHPPNTPTHSEFNWDDEELRRRGLEATVENFMALSDIDCAEEYDPTLDTPLIELSDPSEAGSSPTMVGSEKSAVTESLPSTHNTPSISTTLSSRIGSPNDDPMAEAAFSCSFLAQHLDYDLVYAVEITPVRRFMDEEELLADGGLQKRLLVAYGLEHPLDLDSKVHIDVLRSRGYNAWENKQPKHEEGEFESGCLIALTHNPGPRRLRTSGIVFGAFRKLKYENGGLVRQNVELGKLLDAAMALKEILMKAPSVRAKPKRSNTTPSTSRAYPANEATEVGGEFSIDGGFNAQHSHLS